jgi:hypothetical protein
MTALVSTCNVVIARSGSDVAIPWRTDGRSEIASSLSLLVWSPPAHLK